MQNGKQILNNSGFVETKTAVCEDGRRRGSASSFPAAGALVLGVPVLLLALDGAVRRVPAAVVHGLLLTVVAPLLLLSLRDELLVLRGQLLDLLHELLFALLLHLLTLSVHLTLHVGDSFIYSLPLLFFHFRAQLLQSFSNNSLCLSLVVGLHPVFEVIENLGVLVVAHALADAVASGLGAPVQHSWGRGT